MKFGTFLTFFFITTWSAHALVSFKCGTYEIDGIIKFKKSPDPEKLIMPTLYINKGTLSEQKIPIAMDTQLQKEYEAMEQQHFHRRFKVNFLDSGISPEYAVLISMDFQDNINSKKSSIEFKGAGACK